MKCPCTPDCRERSSDCHAACKAYLAYERERHEKYKEQKHNTCWWSITHERDYIKWLKHKKRRGSG